MPTLSRQSKLNCDVLVAGGGVAGVCAAIAAAREGARVILVQDRPVLGGNASSEIRMHIVGADCSGGRCSELSVEAREGGLIEEIRLEACVRNPQRSASMFDLILYEKCKAEPQLTLLLNSTVVETNVSGRLVESVLVHRPSTEEAFRIAARVFLDCTGDGRLGAEAGAAFREGRESGDEFGESMAPPVADQYRLGSSLLFQARRHAGPLPFQAPAWARRFDELDLKLRPHATAELDRGLEYGYWWIEWGGHLDTLRDNEQIRDELLAIVMGVWDHIKNGGDHSAENWALEWFGFVPGKRETRRFLGQHVLTQNDVLESRPAADAIAFGGWPIDLHPPMGIDAPECEPCIQHPVQHLYDIPLRCCVSSTIDNLMFAGRNISATHVAFASTRVMATCAVVGQGVGTAAAWASSHRIQPNGLSERRDAIDQIQQSLLRQDAFLIGVANQDPADLARAATVTASSEQPAGPATNVISGQTRCVHGERGVATGRSQTGSHRWMSEPKAGLPAWIELQWRSPISAREVRLVFDTGLHRILTFSHADAYTAKMDWGRPQSATVRDYRIEVRVNGVWQTAASVVGNYQRLRIHDINHQPFDRLRIVALATNGLDHARIVEIRVEAADRSTFVSAPEPQ